MKIMRRPGIEHKHHLMAGNIFAHIITVSVVVVVDLLVTCDFQALEVKKGTQQKNREL